MKKSTRSISRPRKAGLSNRNRRKPSLRNKPIDWDNTIATGAASVAVLYQMWVLYRRYEMLYNYYRSAEAAGNPQTQGYSHN